MIRIEGVEKWFGPNRVLAGVSFDADAGELVLLLGGNGAGKSTLLRCLLGLMSYRGTIRIAGLDPLGSGREVRRLIGYMPQGSALHLDLTVGETLQFYSELRSVEQGRARQLLDEVGLGDKLGAIVGELSGGMRQRLQFALALLDDPRVLLLDEPTASLDDDSRGFLLHRLQVLAGDGKTVLVSTHAHRELAPIASRAVTLVAGRAQEIPPSEVAP